MDIVEEEVVEDNVVVDHRDIDYTVFSLWYQMHHLHFEPKNIQAMKLVMKKSKVLYLKYVRS